MNNRSSDLPAFVVDIDPNLCHYGNADEEKLLKATEEHLRRAIELVNCGCHHSQSSVPTKAMEKVLCKCEKINTIPTETKMEKRKKLLAVALLTGTLVAVLIELIVVLAKYA